MTLCCLLAAVSVFALDRFSSNKHLPDEQSPDMRPFKALALSAALDEFESESFALKSDVSLEGVDIVPSSLTGGQDATIPSSAVDVKVVKVMWRYAKSWTSIKPAKSADDLALSPDAIVHDDALLIRDDASRVNYLRCDYDGGPRYVNVSHAVLDEPFNEDLEPVRDAESFVPCALKKDRFKQFWVTVHVPASARPGDYAGTIAVKAKGKTLATLPLKLHVRPFALPLPRTHYDSSIPYVVALMRGPELGRSLKASRDLRQAERKVFNQARALAEHGVNDIHGIGDFTTLDGDDPAVRGAILMRQAGMRLHDVFSPHAFTAKLLPEEVAAFVPFARRQMEGFRRTLPDTTVWFVGADEAKLPKMQREFPFWKEVHKLGGKVLATCDDDVAEGAAWILDGANVANRKGVEVPRIFHGADCRVFTYAAPFLGAENPAGYRRAKGYEFWKNDWDGISDYVMAAGFRWNTRYKAGGEYRDLGIVYPTVDGLVGTVAFESFREGIDDIRYYTLLRLLGEKAIACGHASGRRVLAWFEDRLRGKVDDLDAFRDEVAAQIVALQQAVGPIRREPRLPVPALQPDGGRASCTDSDPCVRAAHYLSHHRADLAEETLTAAVRDGTANEKTRFLRALQLVDVLLLRRKRPTADKVLSQVAQRFESLLADRRLCDRFDRMRFRALTAPLVYMGDFDVERLRAARELLVRRSSGEAAFPEKDLQNMAQALIRAHIRSGCPLEGAKLARDYAARPGTEDRWKSRLLFAGARCCLSAGKEAAGYEMLQTALSHGDGGDSWLSWRLAFELAHKFHDEAQVRKYAAAYRARDAAAAGRIDEILKTYGRK